MAHLELVQPAPLDLNAPPRSDHSVIAQLVGEGARVLDVGCGDGALMRLLIRERGARVRGLELDPIKVHNCVSRGLSVVQGDAERDLEHFPNEAFDYVVFSHALMKLRQPQAALKTAARVGGHVIVSLNNAGHIKTRLRHAFSGRLSRWNEDAPCTARDFVEMTREMRLTLERGVPISGGHPGAPFAKRVWRANWFAEQAVFLLSS